MVKITGFHLFSEIDHLAIKVIITITNFTSKFEKQNIIHCIGKGSVKNFRKVVRTKGSKEVTK